MKVLILGGTRYVGRRLVELMLDAGHEVIVASSGKTSVTERAEHLIVDRQDESSLARAFTDRNWDIAYDQIGYNASDARALVHALDGRVRHLIFTSSQSVYDSGISLNESDFSAEFYDENLSSLDTYQEGKRLAEKEYTMQLNFSSSSVRFPIILGPDDYTGRLAWHISRVKKGLPIYFPNINSRIGFISSREAAEFLFWLKDIRFAGALNAGSSDSISLRELIEKIEKVVGRKVVFATATEASADTETHSPFGIESDWTLNISRAEKLGFEFSVLRDWLDDLIEELAGVRTETENAVTKPKG